MPLKRLAIVLTLAMILAACGGSDPAGSSVEAAMNDDMSEDSTDDNMSEESTDDNMSEESMDDDMSEESMDDDMSDGHTSTTFTVTIRNTSDSAELPTPLAPGAYVVHGAMDTLFAAGELDRGQGLEALAEDGDPNGLVATLAGETTVKEAAPFSVPADAAEAGPALPGSSYSFTFEGAPGDYLSFATMFVQSNDWFFAPAPSGISLFDGDAPLDGDITELVLLWDAGTEIDETPGEGPNQAPRQSGPNTGDVQGLPIAFVDGFAGSVMVTISVTE